MPDQPDQPSLNDPTAEEVQSFLADDSVHPEVKAYAKPLGKRLDELEAAKRDALEALEHLDRMRDVADRTPAED